MQEKKYLIGRQPILNRTECVVAYELLFRSTDSMASAAIKSASHATASVIVNTLSGFGVKEIIGNRRGFINVDIDMLMSDSLELLPKEHIGLELLESIPLDQRVVERCQALKEAGFVLALDDHEPCPGMEDIYNLVDIVKIDLMKTPNERLYDLVENLRRFPAKLLAEKVDTQDIFRMCSRIGFDYFQGYYFARPSVVEKKRLDDQSSTLLKLLHLLLADATLEEIEKVFRSSPGLTYTLLLLVNSVAIGMREKIRNVRHALTILGRQQIKRWVQLALFSTDDKRGMDNPLVEMAAVRASFMEQLASHHPLLKGQWSASDEAFMVGILSLLDRIYQVSIEEIVTDLNLSDEVRMALTDRQGTYGELLKMTELMEQLEMGAAVTGLKEMGIPLGDIISCQMKAFRLQQG